MIHPSTDNLIKEPWWHCSELIDALNKLFLCFVPQYKETQDAQEAVMTTWLREMREQGFPRCVTISALESLLKDNPRNPFRPTIQDLAERSRALLGNAVIEARMAELVWERAISQRFEMKIDATLSQAASTQEPEKK